MSRSTRLERVKGTNDILPPAAARQRAVEGHLLRLFSSYGYAQIDVPLIEHTDLYLRKSGEDTLARLYSFNYQNRKLSLRPEMTASVVRAYVESLQTDPLPVRLSYSGPVFRYEAPQHSRYRQFTQVGLELVGAAGAAADAEAIAIALRGMETLGVRNHRLVIGHIGVLSALLRSLGLDERIVVTLAASMEALQDQGRTPVQTRLAELFPHVAENAAPGDGDEDSLALAALVRTLGEEKARTAVLELLGAMNVGLEGSRSREEIVDRVLAKFSRTRQRPQIDQALGLMEELGQIKGAPDAALRAVADLLTRHGVTEQPLVDLRQTLAALDSYHVPWERVNLDFALSRGLQYYTGLMFEIYHEGTTGERQLCGGGRYDDLVTTLGGSRETPAIGFAYGLERVLLALDAEGRLPATNHAPQVLLVPVEPADHAYAVDVAALLRSQGLSVELDVKGRGVKGNLQHANRQGIPTVVIVGSQERVSRTAVVRNMATHTERHIPFADLQGLSELNSLNPNPEPYTLTQMTDELRMALPSKGELEEDTIRFMAACGLRVDRTNPRQYTARIPATPGVSVLFQRAADILAKVEEGSADIGITGLDIVRESSPEDGDVVVIMDLGYGKCELVLAVPESWIDVTSLSDLADVAGAFKGKGRELRVVTKFPNLTRQFLYRAGITYFSVVEAHGALEVAPSMGYADIISDLTSSGTTLRDNRLKRIGGGGILSAQACLIGNRKLLGASDAKLQSTKTIIELFEAHQRAGDYLSVTANIQGDSAEAVARLVMRMPELAGLQGPSISRVFAKERELEGWHAVTIVVKKDLLLSAVEHLRKSGGSDVTVTPLTYVFEAKSWHYQALLEKVRSK